MADRVLTSAQKTRQIADIDESRKIVQGDTPTLRFSLPTSAPHTPPPPSVSPRGGRLDRRPRPDDLNSNHRTGLYTECRRARSHCAAQVLHIRTVLPQATRRPLRLRAAYGASGYSGRPVSSCATTRRRRSLEASDAIPSAATVAIDATSSEAPTLRSAAALTGDHALAQTRHHSITVIPTALSNARMTSHRPRCIRDRRDRSPTCEFR